MDIHPGSCIWAISSRKEDHMKVRVYVYQSNDDATIGVFGTKEEAAAFQREEGVPEVEIAVETYLLDFIVDAVEIVEG